MAFFYSFTDSLKQKWLQFFQVNRDWIMLHMQVESVYTPDGGKRPPSYLILGVVNALEPKLAQLMLPFSKLNPDADTLVEVLDLHFDPDMAIGNTHAAPTDSSSEESLRGSKQNSATIMESDDVVMSSDNFSETHHLTVIESPEETLIVDTVVQETENGFGYAGLEDHNAGSIDGADAFGDISFDELKDINSSSADDLDSVDADAFRIVDDVWGEENKNSQVDNEIFLGEELSTNAFDDTEIARLFPNN